MRVTLYIFSPYVKIIMILTSMVTVSISPTWAWSNGSYSNNPAHPNYGTHDWIAQHALDWLPTEEKQYISDNLQGYLYGTELPDNGQASDGIGDIYTHHFYYRADERIFDSLAAYRATREYNNTLNLLRNNDYANAAKNAGIMSHYISDLAVFGHVMDAGTDWGKANHLNDYETYANDQTSNYTSQFDSYLSFDGKLETVSAFSAAANLAYDTTFDIDGNLTCRWMDQNYNWSDPTFRNRAGESLNLAANYLADVLHTLYQTYAPDLPGEFYIPVPHHYQIPDYYCGPAALEMVFDYYGPDVPQREIADVARTTSAGTYTFDVVRAAHFSNISTSVGTEIPDANITGYSTRKLGYLALECGDMTIDELKAIIAAGYPVIVTTTRHFRVAIGYDADHITFHDSIGGPMYNLTYSTFDWEWNDYDHWALIVVPLKIELAAPKYLLLGSIFNVTAEIAYPCFSSFPFYLHDQYLLSSVNVTLTSQSGLILAPGENPQKIINSTLFTGTTIKATWTAQADSLGAHTISVTAVGKIIGSLPPIPSYPKPYEYKDLIGSIAQDTITVTESDTIPPVTAHDYNGKWHTTDFTINLNAIDYLGQVSETYYKMNDGPTKTLSTNGPPTITSEGANNTIEYWSTDNHNNEETPHKTLQQIKLDKITPTGSITINNDNAYTDSTSATLQLTASDATSGISQIRYSRDGVWDTEQWQAFSDTREWILDQGDGTKTVYYQIKDTAGLTSAYSDTIILDTTPPNGSITITEGIYTNSSSVTITASAYDATSGIAQIRLSNNNTEWTDWTAFFTNITWTLSPNDGKKTIYAQFKDKAGLVSQSYTTSILLDVTPPNLTITQRPNQEVKSPSFRITWMSADQTSAVSNHLIRIDNGAWLSIRTTTSWTFSDLTDGTHIIDVTAVDIMGNTRTRTFSFTVNTSPLLGPGYSEETAVLAITIIMIAALGTSLYFRKIRKKQ